MTNSRQIELLSRKLAGSATPEELRELQVLLAADAEAAERQKILQQFWIRQEDESGVSVEENLQKVLANPPPPTITTTCTNNGGHTSTGSCNGNTPTNNKEETTTCTAKNSGLQKKEC